MQKKLLQRVHHSGCKYKSVNPERQTNDWVLEDSKVNTVTPSFSESKNTAEILKGRYTDYKYLRKDNSSIGPLPDEEGKKIKDYK